MFNAVLLTMAIVSAPPEAWPAFLGQGATPIDPATIPEKWSPTENIAWQAKLPGKGQSSPVIWGDLVFVTAIEGSMKEKCHLVALALGDGHEAWRQTLASAQPVRSTYTQSRAAPTPVVDADRVYAFFETGSVVAVSHSGKVLWQRVLTEDYGPFESTIGLASSPILVDDVLVILIDHEGPSYLLGLDARTGETRWKTDRTSRSSYASPSVVPIGSSKQIVCSSSGSVDGYDPKTGEMLWTFDENVGGNRTGAPLPIGNGMFAVGASPGMHNEREAEARKSNFVMRVDLQDGRYVPKILWRTEEAMPAYNSPIVVGGFAYWVNRAGVVYCYDAETGKQHYAKRSSGVCWVTPVAIGERLYLFGKDGVTTVLAIGPDYQVLAENMLWDADKVGRDTGPRDRSAGGHQRHGGTSPESSEAPRGNKPADTGVATSPPAEATAEAAKGTGRAERPAVTDAASNPPRMTEQEREEARVRNQNRFADPVQYGVAIVNGSLIVRTGEIVYCIRSVPSKVTPN